jgi:hypothetical protein
MTIVQSVQTNGATLWMLQDASTSASTLLQQTRAMTTTLEAQMSLPGSFSQSTSTTNTLVVAPAFQLAFEQSLGFFDDISNDLWISYYQDRARKAEHYRVPKKTNSRMGWTHHWNFFNWDP